MQQKMKQVLKFKDFFVVEIVWIKAIVELRYNQIKTFCYLKDWLKTFYVEFCQ